MPDDSNRVRPTWAPWLLALGLLALHATLTTHNWKAGFLAGQEFRQTQTAISAVYIQKDNDFSLSYPTPVVGKPWSIPMEFPLYQWSTVWLANATGWSLTVAGRTITLACFYLTLPALFLLLRRLGCRPGEAIVALAPVLAAPLYIYFSRAFLIESMALAGSVWFLAAFVESIQRRHLAWLVIAMVAGVLAALVKVTTFLVWLAPAAVYGAWLLLKIWRESGGRDWPALLRLAGWMIVAVAGACVAAVWWVHYSDAVKMLNISGRAFTSTNLVSFNFGTWQDRFSPAMWGRLVGQWSGMLAPWWLAAAVLGGAFVRARGTRPGIALALGVFLTAQLAFPVLYSVHDYYFYAAGVALLVALGLAVVGLLRSPGLKWAGWGALAVLLGVQLQAYHAGYFQIQKVITNGGSGLADAIRHATPPDSVIIVIGEDWSSVLPYTAQRRALMIRSDKEDDEDFQAQAFKALAGEQVAALVVFTERFNNEAIIRHIGTAFDLDEQVTFSYRTTDVYVSRRLRNDVLKNLGPVSHPYYNEIVIKGSPTPPPAGPQLDGREHATTLAQFQRQFAAMSPKPQRYRFTYAPESWDEDGHHRLGAHPDSALVFRPPGGTSAIECEYGISAAAYERLGGATDGVVFTISEHRPDGSVVKLFERWLEPAKNPADRGMQSLVLPCRPATQAELFFETGPGPNNDRGYDWAYWGRINIR